MRDENGFKCHVASESHVRKMQVIGEDPRKAINEFSQQLLRDFVQLLRTAHGEKKVHLNHFYQEYIADKKHVHMNATKWNSLTEFGKYLGREGICRVTEEEEKGIFISWIDNSPEALRRQEAIRKKERQDKGDEEREQRQIQEQVERANRERIEEAAANAGRSELVREEGKKIQLNFGAKKAPSPPQNGQSEQKDQDSSSGSEKEKENKDVESGAVKPPASTTAAPLKMSLKPVASGKPKNVFASSGKRKEPTKDQPKAPMSNAQRIMMEEQAKRRRVF